jgi:hypothetical protein
MAQRTLKRVLAGGALLAALTLTTPPPAQAASFGAEGLWSWLSGLWGGPAPTTVGGHTYVRRHSPRTGSWDKIGPCIDPNGSTGTQTGSSCGTGSSLAPVVDPNA